MPASAIRKYVPLSDALKRQGVNVFHLNIGQPDVATPALFFESLKQFDRPVLEYENSAGNADLKQAISEYYASCGLEVSPKQTIVTSGGSEALTMAIAIACDPGDEIIVPEPFYTNYGTFALQNQVTIVPFPTRLEDNFAISGLDKLESLITPRTKAILVCSPNNPTGAVLTRKEMETVCAVARKHDLFVISDEVYREFVYDGAEATSLLSMPDMDDLAIMVDSVSKRYSVCGARVGWLVSRNEDVMAAALKYAQARLCVATVEQCAATQLIREGQSEVLRAKEEYDGRRKVAFAALSEAGLKCGYPSGALYLMVDLGVDADEFTRFMLTDYSGIVNDRQTAMVTPAASFYRTPGQGLTQARVAFVLEASKLEKAIAHLLRGLEEFKKKTQ